MGKNVLIVVDMQNDFISGSLGTPEAQAIVPKVAEKIAQFNGDIFYTMDTHDDTYLSAQEGQNLPVLHCQEGTEGWQLAPEIINAAPVDPEKVYCKNQFGSVELAEDLQYLNAEELIDSNLVMTEKGRTEFQSLMNKLNAVESYAFQKMGKEQVELMLNGMKQFSQAFAEGLKEVNK